MHGLGCKCRDTLNAAAKTGSAAAGSAGEDKAGFPAASPSSPVKGNVSPKNDVSPKHHCSALGEGDVGTPLKAAKTSSAAAGIVGEDKALPSIRDFDSTLCVMVCDKTGQCVIRITPLHECFFSQSYRVMKRTTV
jgi:hypothetical protein